MTKIMFLAFWYSSIFPAGQLLAAVALGVNYYTDRFSLMRTWQRPARVGTEISTISLNYFFSAALIVLACMSSFYWAAFPFDNLCPTDFSTNSSFFGVQPFDSMGSTGNLTIGDGEIAVSAESSFYRFCNQDFILRPEGPDFPFIYKEGVPGAGEWMSPEQQFLSKLFGWTSVGFICLVLLKFSWGIYRKIKREYVTDYEPSSVDQGINFHDVHAISGYVPQVRSTLFSYPLVVCDCDLIGDRLFDWTDPDHDYGFYDLTKDAEYILTGGTAGKNSFDRIAYWPPEAEMSVREKIGKRSILSVFNTGSVRGGLK